MIAAEIFIPKAVRRTDDSVAWDRERAMTNGVAWVRTASRRSSLTNHYRIRETSRERLATMRAELRSYLIWFSTLRTETTARLWDGDCLRGGNLINALR